MSRPCGLRPRWLVPALSFEKDEQLDLLNTTTGEINLAHAPDEIRFEVDQFNKRVVTPEFNRVVAEELANHIDPDAPGAGKTLIFAATDAHADIVVSAVKKAFAGQIWGDRRRGGEENHRQRGQRADPDPFVPQ